MKTASVSLGQGPDLQCRQPLAAKDFDPRQNSPLKPFEERAAGCRYIGELVTDPGICKCRQRVATTGDRHHRAIGRQRRNSLRDMVRGTVEWRELKGPHGTVPDHRPACLELVRHILGRGRSGIKDHLALADITGPGHPMRNIRGKFAGHKEIFRKHDVAAIRFRAGLDRTGGVHHIGFDERRPDILSARKEKGIRHTAAKDQDIDTCDQIFQNLQLQVLENLVTSVDILILGGGMANTFLLARGQDVGASLVEADMVDTARAIEASAKANGCHIVLPEDFLVAGEFAANVPHRVAGPGDVGEGEMILDAGPASAQDVAHQLETCRTVVWNGPMGAFEFPPFDSATNHVAKAVATLTADGAMMSVAGGGDTLAALANAGVSDQFTYVSTAGGAFLEWLEGRVLPGVEVLRR